MKFLVKGEDEIKDLYVDEKHILISIKSPSSRIVKLPDLKSRIATLFLEFHDLDGERFPKTQNNPKYVLFDNIHAEKILKFVDDNKNKVDLIICQCEAGISRSAGVAGALSKIFNNDDTFFFKRYLPNRYVYRTILECYFKKG